MIEIADARALGSGLDHPEGVAAGQDGLLYAGGEGGQVYRIDPASGTAEQIADTGGYNLGVALDGAGGIYVCDAGNAAVMRVDADGRVERYCESAGGQPLRVPNWAAFSEDGSLLVSDSGSEALDVVDGRLFRIPPGGGDAELLDLPPLHFPNGLVVAPDGTAYVLESFTPRLSRLTPDGLETVADLPGCVPDGVALTADGDFVVACYYPFKLLLVSAAGEVSVLLEDPTGITMAMPTNVAFFGEGRTSMAIACLGGHAVLSVDAPFAGAELHRPA